MQVIKKRFRKDRFFLIIMIFVFTVILVFSLTKIKTWLKDRNNNNEVIDKTTLLMAFANGGFYGGGYNCAPLADVTDGLLDMVLVKKISVLTFAKLVKYYKAGKHVNNKRFEKIVTYKKCHKVTVESDDLLCLCLDGETFHMNKVDIEIVPQAVRFVFPKK